MTGEIASSGTKAALPLLAEPIDLDQLFEGDRISGVQTQHARHVIRRLTPQRARLAGHERARRMDSRQSHVASSMPSRATSTIRSISSGVTT